MFHLLHVALQFEIFLKLQPVETSQVRNSLGDGYMHMSVSHEPQGCEFSQV